MIVLFPWLLTVSEAVSVLFKSSEWGTIRAACEWETISQLFIAILTWHCSFSSADGKTKNSVWMCKTLRDSWRSEIIFHLLAVAMISLLFYFCSLRGWRYFICPCTARIEHIVNSEKNTHMNNKLTNTKILFRSDLFFLPCITTNLFFCHSQ